MRVIYNLKNNVKNGKVNINKVKEQNEDGVIVGITLVLIALFLIVASIVNILK